MPPKIIFLDLEGTLIDVPRVIETSIPKSMWQSLAQLLGEACLAEEEASHKRWLNGEIPNYTKWMDETVRSFIRHGLNKSAVDQLTKLISPVNGIVEFIQAAKNKGAVVAIITGALKSIAEPIQIMTKAQHMFAGCELFFDTEGRIAHWNLLPSDWYGKVDFMHLLIKEYKSDPRECVFIGDGANDVELAKQVGLSIAFNADPALKAVAKICIDQPADKRDFQKLLPFVLDHWNK